MPIHTYTNWNSRPSDAKEQMEPYRKYFFICEGANTETFYFKQLIGMRKQLMWQTTMNRISGGMKRNS